MLLFGTGIDGFLLVGIVSQTFFSPNNLLKGGNIVSVRFLCPEKYYFIPPMANGPVRFVQRPIF
jgi:hypothetical protein